MLETQPLPEVQRIPFSHFWKTDAGPVRAKAPSGER